MMPFPDLVIRHVYRFFDEWQAYIGTLPVGADRACHEQVLRLLKGVVKALRIWRDERSVNPAQQQPND